MLIEKARSFKVTQKMLKELEEMYTRNGALHRVCMKRDENSGKLHFAPVVTESDPNDISFKLYDFLVGSPIKKK